MPVDRKFHPRIGDSEKIGKLTDMEFRVWFTYVMVADDFGVLPMISAKIKAGDRTLANRKPVQIERALEVLVSVALVRRFEHQGAAYIWSENWQEHQEIRYPRREQTHYPAPPVAELEALDGDQNRSTRELFATFHTKVPAAFRDRFGNPTTIASIAERERKRSDTKPRRSRDIPATVREHSQPVATLTHARTRETAHGSRLTAEVLLEEKDSASFDGAQALRELQAAYPSNRVSSGYRTESAFFEQISAGNADDIYATMRANLGNHIASHEWRVKGMIPALEKWLRDGLWRRQLPADAPVAERLSKSTNVTMDAAAELLKARPA